MGTPLFPMLLGTLAEAGTQGSAVASISEDVEESHLVCEPWRPFSCKLSRHLPAVQLWTRNSECLKVMTCCWEFSHINDNSVSQWGSVAYKSVFNPVGSFRGLPLWVCSSGCPVFCSRGTALPSPSPLASRARLCCFQMVLAPQRLVGVCSVSPHCQLGVRCRADWMSPVCLPIGPPPPPGCVCTGEAGHSLSLCVVCLWREKASSIGATQ